MNPHVLEIVPGDPPFAGSFSTPSSGQEAEAGEKKVDDFDYAPVPPRKAMTVSVCCHVRGRGAPLPYLLDEGIDE